MPETKPKYYVTTPIYYVNARPHIGHAYTTIVADVVARRRRLLGDDVWFLTGTDEHGQKIERAAKAAGTSPQEFADSVSIQFRNLWDRMGLTYDQYIRTTDADHKRGVAKLFRELKASGDIYLNAYTGAYCVSDETFVDAPVGTPCPDCGRILEEVTEENYFFKLSAYQERIIDLIESDEMRVESASRKNEVLSFLRGNVSTVITEVYDSYSPGSGIDAIKLALEKGLLKKSKAGANFVPGALKDLSISRTSFKWGIPVPDDEKHVIYVWLDALTNYISALGYGSDDESKFKDFWPADLHLVGKEIIRFHCVYWPAFLMAANLPLPKKIVAHGWLLFEESKMSKSRGNIVRAETILEAFGALKPELDKKEQDLFGADVLRYFLLREISFGSDGSFSFDALVTRYNADLANGYGNLVSRTLKMISGYFEDKIPTASEEVVGKISFLGTLQMTFGYKEDFLAPLYKNLDELEFEKYLQGVSLLVSILDETITRMAPWKKRETEDATRENQRYCLYYTAEGIRVITALLYPIMPFATAQVWSALGLGDINVAAKSGGLDVRSWQTPIAGTKLGILNPIFPRADKELITRMNELEQKNSPAPAATEAVAAAAPVVEEKKDTAITIDDFMKVELRVAQIKVAERIPKADKLLRLEVDLGTEQRQILSGIAEHYTPEELIGRRIVIVANLAPRKMRGLESHGMLLAASVGDGDKPVLATVPDDAVLGSRVR